VEGVSLTLADVIKIFDKYGIKSIEAIDKPFDPTVHEAVMQESVADVPDNTVIKELQKGYWLHDRLLRPSMVVVSKT
jgi:molecular chaperone GrpE